MNILLIETATEACSCALAVDEHITQRYSIEPRKHAALILNMADELLREAHLKPTDLHAVAFGCGPGSFTGLRIACGVAQGIAFAANIPVIPISSLASLAQLAYQEWGETCVLAGIDARLQEVYWGIYQANAEGVMLLQGDECVCPASQTPFPTDTTRQWLGIGSAWGTYADVLQQRFAHQLKAHHADYYPTASTLYPLARYALQTGKTVDAAMAMPVYLRNNVVK
ncbi:universal bacterial protein YeaZ [Beggiatoa alba B18LD]|uniref:tRNA threonylcarbamoyladenosine biosynthesis protein TsaB n=1 Tax=Beggiatoa alba B18LD TaxID=395493 RepID=I3CJ17_9GAMM|nr:tRNA (adenosine(37)-N6)-threonylcarbamoyltransferase complex dimerization subunit type 1 TsaB [Beggiatoa alba]EIJ43610.1 universal bacterial protein YeaZ [Beggiatoa alba B18LD]